MYVIFRIYFSPIIRYVENFKKNILKNIRNKEKLKYLG